MILALNNIDIPKQCQHDPSIQNKYGDTVATILVSQKIMPPREWMHNYDIIHDSILEFTLKDYLKHSYLPIP